jgi:hypothetical protein
LFAGITFVGYQRNTLAGVALRNVVFMCEKKTKSGHYKIFNMRKAGRIFAGGKIFFMLAIFFAVSKSNSEIHLRGRTRTFAGSNLRV